MKVFIGTFIKKNGQYRKMVFSRLCDLDKDFLESKILGTGSEKRLEDNSELVWDWESNNFRIFNWNTLIGKINKKEIAVEEFNLAA